MADWSNLPEDLLNLIAVRLFSVVELKRFRSICTSWRSSVSGTGNNNLIPRRPLIQFTPITSSFTEGYNHIYRFNPGAFLSRAAFFRVTRSSSTSKGWLIKSDVDINSGRFRLLQPVSRLPLRRPLESLDLLEFTVSEIQEAYAVLGKVNGRITTRRFSRSVLVKVKEGEDHHYGVLGIGHDGNITYWKGQVLKLLEHVAQFSDIIVHKGLTYALDSQGTVWLINSHLEISRYGRLSLEENITSRCCGDMRFVECCGELYIVERLPEGNPRKRKVGERFNCFRTAGFKVYKMDDEELGRLKEVKSLGDNAFIIATDTCFSVMANEFYGCLHNSIYFTEDKETKLFKLDNGNGSIATKSECPSSFEMFVPTFLEIFV